MTPMTNHPTRDELREAMRLHNASTREFADQLWLAMADAANVRPAGMPARIVWPYRVDCEICEGDGFTRDGDCDWCGGIGWRRCNEGTLGDPAKRPQLEADDAPRV